MKTTARFTGDISVITAFQENDMAVSRLTEFSSQAAPASTFGIKYVASGKERYVISNKTHEVSSGQYLFVNKGEDIECHFKSNVPVEGFCVSLDKEMMTGIYKELSASDEELLDDPYQTPEEFAGLHQLVYSKSNPLSKYLQELMRRSQDASFKLDNYELFYDIGVQVIRCHTQTNKKIHSLNASRLSTRKELFERLEFARHILDEEFDQPLKVARVASLAALSEFHFFRTFKTVYGLSPHQYILQKKLERAEQLINENHLSLTEIAYETGFNDIQSFSKFFRQRRGHAPSRGSRNIANEA